MSRERRALTNPAAHRHGDRRLLMLTEAAEFLGLSVASVRRLVSAGKLPVVRLTRRIQVDTRDLERMLEQAKERLGW